MMKDLLILQKFWGVSVEALKNFSEDSVINYFNNFYDESAKGQILNNSCSNLTFNPLDKLIEAYEENKKLYERLVQAEKEKVEFLEKILKDK